MDNKTPLQNAKELAKQHFEEDLAMLERIDSIDTLATLMFGASYSSLATFRVLKTYISDVSCVYEQCKKIQDNYTKRFKSPD